MAGNRKAVHDISPTVRGAFIRAVARIGNGDGEGALADIIEKELINNPVQMLAVMARYLPQKFTGTVKHEHKHDHEHRTVSDTAAFITEAIGEGTDSAHQKSLPH